MWLKNNAFYVGGIDGGPKKLMALLDIKKEAGRNGWRLFKLPFTMHLTDIQGMLDALMFSGPIADPTRGKARDYREVSVERHRMAEG